MLGIHNRRNTSHLFHTESRLAKFNSPVQNLILKLQDEGIERHRIEKL